MFWGETKSVATWEILLAEMNAKMVIDLTPGSGALASACMSRGLPYVGMVRDHHHFVWLTNVVDSASLQYICKSGNVLYQEDLATHLQELFAETVAVKSFNDEAIEQSDNEK